MKTFGRTWSRAEFLTLIGVIAAVLAIPGMAKLLHGDFAPGNLGFSQAGSTDLNPQERTCLDDSTQVIPAGVPVCATIHGSWLDGSGPLRPDNHGPMAIWTRQAHPPFAVLTSPHAYQHPDTLEENVDYVVCVEAPGGTERANAVADRMNIDVVRKSLVDCAAVSVHP